LRSYSAKDIKEILNTLHLGEYLSLVDDNKITGDFLTVCDNLKEVTDLGISKEVHAKALLKRIKELQAASG
jgi:SAM domain (Sterile alpha motif)